ncbi:aspartate/glutamate racemase family protein [Catenuloplanes sp. NPDC051500]|uniref:aspartate/glutamate racemase family protein n=1 Tax=Catenuloplanes sp. NPDC051500 TaxID=3363959 RepID=UPI00378D8E0B
MRLWFQKHTVAGRLPLLDKWYDDHLAALVAPGTTVDIHTLPEGTYGDDTPFDLVGFGSLALRFNGYFGETALTAEREGYDAWIIAAGQDPGLREARTLATIPALGYTETATFLAAMQNHRFGVLGFMPKLREPITDNITRQGLRHLLSSYEIADDGAQAVHAALNGDFALFLETFGRAAQRAVDAGAQLLIPAEGIPNEIFWHLGVHELHGVPVIDPAGLAVKAAELLVQANTSGIFARTGAGYWFRRPEPHVTEHVERVFQGNLIGRA